MKLKSCKVISSRNRKIVLPLVLIIIVALVIALYGFISKDSKEGISKVNINFKTYKNNFKLDQEWDDYGIGDPYIFKYDGMYYLYCSTKDFRKGIKAWSSKDLILWKYEGLVTNEDISTGAYAPEVIYWNGYFYMYTSPGGQGHYVLKSDKPTGPFKVATDNFGLSIDGSVFIDDDGKFYFTHAGDQGIVGHEMTDPLTVNLSGKTLKAYLNGWTEGPMIIKRDGFYYLTYTGNHVFSKGYRINYAVAKDSPIGNYVVPDNNPIVISTRNDFNGLGHSSTIIGPNLDSYYIVYHNLIGKSKEGPPVREMDIDRIVFNGARMDVLGPTDYNQPVPQMPEFYAWLQNKNSNKDIKKSNNKDNQILFIDKNTGNNFTAEYNFSIKDDSMLANDSKIGAIFSYINENNYVEVSVNLKTKVLELYKVSNGEYQLLKSAQLPIEFDFKKLHSIKIEKLNRSVKIFFDNMLKINTSVTDISIGKIGYVYKHIQPIFDYTAFSNQVDGSSDYDAFKPVPGRIEAVHFMTGKDVGYHANNNEKKEGSYRSDSEIQTSLDTDKSYSVILNKDEWLNYNINVKNDGLYGFDFMLKKLKQDVIIQLYVDGIKLGNYKISTEGSTNNDGWTKSQIGQLNLHKGFHELKIKLVRGTMNLKWMEFYNLEVPKETDFQQLTFYGLWLNKDGAFHIDTPSDVALKAYGGSDNWANYKLEGDIKLNANDETDETGLMFRVTNESSFEAQVQDSFMGYRVRLGKDEVVLEKVNYGSNTIKTIYGKFDTNKYIHIKILVENSDIKVYIENMKKPILEYSDYNAFMHGKIGIQTNDSKVSFKNITVKPIK